MSKSRIVYTFVLALTLVITACSTEQVSLKKEIPVESRTQEPPKTAQVYGCGISIDFSKLSKLAKQHYGQESFKTVTALQQLINRLKTASEREKLRGVNNFFNQQMDFTSDMILWKKSDYWETPLEFMGKQAGDCEDFSIAKYIILKLLCVPDEKLRITYVRADVMQNEKLTDIAHMVVSYYAKPESDPLILDNLKPEILPSSKRSDLLPVFQFNDKGLWDAENNKLKDDSTANLSRWRDVLVRMQADGIKLH